jgi:hypothetical protein
MQREYGIDLVDQLDRLTWRRLLVLIRGLSPNSATVTQRLTRRPDGVSRPRGAIAVQRAFEALFRPPDYQPKGRPA